MKTLVNGKYVSVKSTQPPLINGQRGASLAELDGAVPAPSGKQKTAKAAAPKKTTAKKTTVQKKRAAKKTTTTKRK